MNKFLMILCTAVSLTLLTLDADAARRLGGGSSVGAQRNMTAQPPAKSPAQQAAPAAAPAPTPAPQPQPSGMSRWLGPLAGLALGAGLASMFMNGGMTGAMGGILMIVLLAVAALFAWRMLSARSGSNNTLQYAGGTDSARAPAPAPAIQPVAGSGMPRIGSALGGAADAAPAATAGRFPPGFDAEQFARHAKNNFARLQQANDKRDVSTMRDYMTPQLYSEISAAIDPMGVAQNTEILNLDAAVVEVVSESDKHVASVRFTGTLRDSVSNTTETFDEYWHLEKPLDGSSGWLISGIQQA